MALDVNSSSVGSSSGNVRRANARQRAGSQEHSESLDSFAPPKNRAHVNFIPSVGSLSTLIDSAVAALRKGVYWDRGSILNLLT